MVFLDYDGTLAPIVDRPEDAVVSESLRARRSGGLRSGARSAPSAAAIVAGTGPHGRARWPRRDGDGLATTGDMYVTAKGGRNVRVGRLLGLGMGFQAAWEQVGHITLEGAEAIKQIGGHRSN